MNQHGGPAELIESFKSEAVGSAGAVLSESAASPAESTHRDRHGQ